MATPQERAAAGRANAAAAALRHWLLTGPAQIDSGPEAGAIAGTLDTDGRADYAYAEITGYYLHWLASPHLRRGVDENALIARAAAAAQWCERRVQSPGALPTRVDLRTGASGDWRNQALFCFDLAMLVGGLTAARRRSLIEPPQRVLTRLLQQLTDFASDGGLIPLRMLARGTDLPARWSTRPGAFLVKAAARILSAQAVIEVPPVLEAACQVHLERFAAQPPGARDEPAHPILYFLEGELALACERNPASASLLKNVLKPLDAAGNLPEAKDSAVLRSDIVAQALRLAVLLRACGERRAPPDATLDLLANNLTGRVRSDGSIAFREGQAAPQINVWCAMFAEQALSWYGQWRGTRTLNANAWDIV